MTGELIVAFLTLTSLEIILGIDNILFIGIVASRLPEEHRDTARRLGLLVAVASRIVLVLGISWVMHLTKPLMNFGEIVITGKDLVLVVGGFFLIAKATIEIHRKVGGSEEGGEESSAAKASTLRGALIQIALVDLVFSLDSVITAVGMVEERWVMIAAILASVAIMMWFSKQVLSFIDRHPPIKILALSFLVLIGVVLVAEGLHHHIPKATIYVAMGFSMVVELLQIRMTKGKRTA